MLGGGESADRVYAGWIGGIQVEAGGHCSREDHGGKVT